MFRENDQIGSYRLVKKLGRGAFGVVWLAEERTLVSAHIALKLLTEDDIDIEAIRHEASLWESVKGHPNILHIIKARLTAIFKQREEYGIFREGTNLIEKTVFVKSSRSLKYGDVIKVIDAVKSAGAESIGLQIDDLSNRN